MKLLLKIFIYIFILNININKSYSLVILPLKTLPKENYIFYKEDTPESIIKKYFYSDIYTILNIGSIHQETPLFLSVAKSIFQIASALSGSSNLANDTIFFYDKLDLNSNNNAVMNFEPITKFQIENIKGEIGLAFPNKNLDNYYLIKETNLLFQLKEKKITNNYNWFFLYDKWDNTDGKLVIGALPHDLLPKKYKQTDLIFTKSLADPSTGHNWKIKFKDIYLNSFHLFNLTAEFIFDSELTVAPSELDSLLLKLFLQEELNNENCEEGYYYQDSHYVTTLKYYYCKSNIQKELYEAIPNIKFNSKELNYTFEISKDDLLQVEYNYVFLKLLFFIEDSPTWLLGKPFSLKYQFVFNPDTKEIGMYNPNYVTEKPKRNFTQCWLVFTIIILCIIFTVLGVIIGKKIYGLKRKQKANELNDEFEYISAGELNKEKRTNNINDINRNNNFIINNSVSGYKSIEMNTQFY